jgi:two-component system sensor histidine kinase YesM
MRRLPLGWFKKQLIRNKIIIVYMPVIIVPLFVLAFVSNHIFTQSIINKTSKNAIDESSLIVMQMGEIISNAESCAKILTTDLNKIVPIDQTETANPMLENRYRTSIQNQISLSLLVFPNVDAAAFIDTQDRIYSSNYVMEKNHNAHSLNQMVEQLKSTSGGNRWFPMERRDFLTTDASEPVLTLGKKVIRVDTGDTLGYLILIIKESALSSIYDSIGQVQQKNYFILDPNKNVISSTHKEMLLQPLQSSQENQMLYADQPITQIIRLADAQYLVTSVPYEHLNWHLASEIPIDILTADARKITWTISFISILCILTALLAAGMLSKIIAGPLIQLTQSMAKVKEGEFSLSSEVNTPDEIGFLYRSFNKMIRQIHELIQQVHAEQKQKREYELALIQAQIKPHFLYNSLDLIYVLITMNRNISARDATKALADFYRIALSGGKEIITLAEELKNVTDYLSIQKIRYSDIFEFILVVDEEIVLCEILKLTIQPLVENAIYHGLKTKGTMGKLRIEGKKAGEHVILRIIDDGVGMEKEKTEKLLRGKDDDSSRHSFGLHSVHERIKLHFGSGYGIKIKSSIGAGTEVEVNIPYRIRGVRHAEGINCG